jgi:uncharacterized membrane-anchored protein
MSGKERTINRRRQQLIVLVLLQLLFLCGVAGSYYAVGWFGQEIKVKTIPVDPRDLLYGDYVTLSYEMSQLKPELWKEQSPRPEPGSKVYVLMKPSSNGLYEAIGLYGSKPAIQTGEVVLRGMVDSSWNEAIRVRYGLEKYYVPEGAGRELEKQAGNLVVRVKVASWGQMKIDGLEKS